MNIQARCPWIPAFAGMTLFRRINEGAFVTGGTTHKASGLLFALAGFALLSCGDAVIKSLGGIWPGTAIAALRYTFGAIFLGGLLWVREGRAGFVCPMPWAQFGRGASIAMGSTFFFVSLFVMPLAEVTVIQFISPMMVALLSAVILKEHAPREAWVATAIAFVGVIIVLRPEAMKLGWVVILPLIGALGMALMMVFNRKVAGRATALQMQFLISVFAVPVLIGATVAGHLSGLPSLHVSWPPVKVIAVCAIIACTASLAHGLIYMSTERAPAASTAPAVYVQLLTAMALGYLFYDEVPDLLALGGAVLIVGAGIYLWRASRRG
jgi:drug/metabolite transporter (DMT)-like permease